MKNILLFILFLVAFQSYGANNTTTATTKTTATLSKTCSVQTQNINFGTILPGQSSSVAVV